MLTGNPDELNTADSFKTTVCGGQGNELGSAGGDGGDVTVEASGEGGRVVPDAGVGTAGIDEDGDSPQQKCAASGCSRGEEGPRRDDDDGSRTGKNEQILIISARDVRVEFPTVATACTGDMEYGNVLRWLRRFRPVVLQQESKTKGIVNPGGNGVPPPTPGPSQTYVADHGVLMSAAAAEDTDSFGGISWSGEAVKGGPSGKISVDAMNARAAMPPRVDVAPPLGRPGLIRRPAAWLCHFVEAKEFGLSVALAGDNAGGASAGGGDGRADCCGDEMVPEVCCSVSGISVFTATYATAPASGGDSGVHACDGLHSNEGRVSIEHPPPPVPPHPVASGAEALLYGRDRHRPVASETQGTEEREEQDGVIFGAGTGVSVSTAATSAVAEERALLQDRHRRRPREMYSTTKASQLPSEERLHCANLVDDLCTISKTEATSAASPTAATADVASKAAPAATGDIRTIQDHDSQPPKRILEKVLHDAEGDVSQRQRTGVGAEELRGGASGGSSRAKTLVREMRRAREGVARASWVAAAMGPTRHCAESRIR